MYEIKKDNERQTDRERDKETDRHRQVNDWMDGQHRIAIAGIFSLTYFVLI